MRMLKELLNRVILKNTGSLDFTNQVKFDWRIVTCRTVKQKYYPVSKRLEEMMRTLLKKKLVTGFIERSDGDWSSSIVMLRKGNDLGPDGKRQMYVVYR